MKKSLLIIVLLVSGTFASFAQYSPSQLTIQRKGGENQFHLNGQRLRLSEAKDIFALHPDAYEHFRSARTTYTFATITGCVGGFGIGWFAGGLIADGDPEWAVLGVGGAFLIAGISLLASYNKKSARALDAYYASPGLSQQSFRPTLDLNFAPTGIGLAVRF